MDGTTHEQHILHNSRLEEQKAGLLNPRQNAGGDALVR